MLYCPQCKRLVDGEKCPVCGNKSCRAPEKEDFCLLYSGGQIWADMACDVLKQNDIPTINQSARGAAMAVLTGLLSDNYDVYVPYASYDEAKNIIDELFSSPVIEEDEAEEALEQEEEEEDE